MSAGLIRRPIEPARIDEQFRMLMQHAWTDAKLLLALAHKLAELGYIDEDALVRLEDRAAESGGGDRFDRECLALETTLRSMVAHVITHPNAEVEYLPSEAFIVWGRPKNVDPGKRAGFAAARVTRSLPIGGIFRQERLITTSLLRAACEERRLGAPKTARHPNSNSDSNSKRDRALTATKKAKKGRRR